MTKDDLLKEFDAGNLPAYVVHDTTAQFITAMIEKARNEALDEASQELEKAFDEAGAFHLLHGAARVRSLKKG